MCIPRHGRWFDNRIKTPETENKSEDWLRHINSTWKPNFQPDIPLHDTWAQGELTSSLPQYKKLGSSRFRKTSKVSEPG
jgi:hypothetical protein